MHAIIETGGKQYKVTEGDTLFIEKLASEAGENVTFDKVLAVIDGDKITVGTPVVEGAKVDASVVRRQRRAGPGGIGQGAGERRFHHHENPRRPERGQ